MASRSIETELEPHGRKRTVVTLLDVLTPSGGAERLATQIAMRLDPERYERILCVSRWNPSWLAVPAVAHLVDDLRSAGVELLLLERRSRLTLWTWLPLLRLLRERRVDLLHAHKFGSNLWGTLIGRAARVPLIVAHEHMWSFSGQRARPWLDRNVIAAGADAFIAVSEDSRRRMIELERIDPARLRVIRNGIPATAPGDPCKLRAELGVDDSIPLVGAVAVLRREKRIDLLIRAAGRLARERPGLRVIVAGEGPERPALEALRSELGLDDVVLLPGPRHDIPDFLAALDVAVLCSDFEGGPLALMEYMRAAKPVVATRTGGIPELVNDGESGLLVPPGGDAALAEAIGRLLDDRALGARLAARGREHQQANYDIDRTVERIDALYRELFDRGSSRHGARGRHWRRAAADLQVERIGSLDEAREDWTRLAERCPNPFSTWEWADAWWRVWGADRELELWACRRGGELVAILPLCRTIRTPLRTLRFVGHGPSDRLGPVCAPEERPVALTALERVLARGGWDVFIAERMTDGDGVATRLGGRIVLRESSPLLRFDGSWDEFLAARSRNFRDQARRRERRLRREHDVRYRLSDGDRLDGDMETLFALHDARWGEAGSGAFNDERRRFHRDFAARALGRGWLRLYVLELDGEAAAAWYGLRYAGADWYYQSGRDPAREREAVGFVLMAHTIRTALDDGLREYHLLRGGEEYKARFANADEPVATITVARGVVGRAASAAASAYRTLPAGAKDLARTAVGGR